MKYSILLLICSLFLFSQCKKSNTEVNTNDLNFIGSGNGCSTFFVYKLNEDKKIGLTVNGNRDSLGLNDDIQTFDLANERLLKVNIEKLQNGDSFYCDDVFENNETILNTYEGQAGLVKIQIIEDSINFSPLNFEVYYKINVSLENIKLKDSDGDELTIEQEDFTEVLVGWLPG